MEGLVRGAGVPRGTPPITWEWAPTVYDRHAYEAVSVYRDHVKSAVSKAARRYGSLIERDDLESQATEALLVFAGYLASEHVNAGRLREWRLLPGAMLARYLQRALDLWLFSYATHEIARIRRRPSMVSYDVGAHCDLKEADDEATSTDVLGGSWYLRDPAAEIAFSDAELRLFMRDFPILSLHYLHDMLTREIAHALHVTVSVIRTMEAKERAIFRHEWKAAA